MAVTIKTEPVESLLDHFVIKAESEETVLEHLVINRESEEEHDVDQVVVKTETGDSIGIKDPTVDPVVINTDCGESVAQKEFEFVNVKLEPYQEHETPKDVVVPKEKRRRSKATVLDQQKKVLLSCFTCRKDFPYIRGFKEKIKNNMGKKNQNCDNKTSSKIHTRILNLLYMRHLRTHERKEEKQKNISNNILLPRKGLKKKKKKKKATTHSKRPWRDLLKVKSS